MFAACSMQNSIQQTLYVLMDFREINYGLQKIGVAGPVGSGKTALLKQ